MKNPIKIFIFSLCSLFSSLAFASVSEALPNLHMTNTGLGLIAIAFFCIAYLLVISEEMIELRKSKPVMLAAGLIWLMVAIAAKSKGMSADILLAVKHNILEYAELFLFLLVAMTYVNTIEERGVFDALKGWLIRKQYSYRTLFWITGIFAFFLSPIADNMTTALVMCAIILAVGVNNRKFVVLSCINIVVAANAGGAFSPFGDITTLMVWQNGILPFSAFFKLFLPCVVNFMVPALLMHFALPKEIPRAVNENSQIADGGLIITGLFLVTIVTTVCFHQYFSLPPTIGMMTGLALLQFYGYFLKRKLHYLKQEPFDIFPQIYRIEWDTLLFFYGVMLCVGGLATFGYLELASNTMYGEWGAHFSQMHQQSPANIAIGVISALVDNIPLMFAVLTMNPVMSDGQWLLITLAAGVGGSLLSIGSAAGVALMGQSKGQYTFLSHLKWSWAILLGYFASIAVHFWVNKSFF